MTSSKVDIASSALIVVDMQNDVVSKNGYFDRMARKHPEAQIDMEFLASPISNIQRRSLPVGKQARRIRPARPG